jgi:hypothetical protein
MLQGDTAFRGTTVVEDQADRYSRVGEAPGVGAADSAHAHLGY